MHPILFEIGPVKVYTYGLMMAIGMFAAVYVARKLAPQLGINPDKITDMAVIAIVGGLIGSNINFVISYDWHGFVADPLSIFRFWERGLVFLGGLIGGALFAIVYIRRQKWPLWEITDICAIAIPLAYGFGRIGCFLGGCCYGRACQLPWAITFPGHLFPRHPTQLYSMLLGFGLAAFAYWFRRKRRFAGQSFLFYLLFYGGGRSVIELFREEPRAFGTPLSVAQFTGLLLILTVLVLYPILAKRNRYPEPSSDQ